MDRKALPELIVGRGLALRKPTVDAAPALFTAIDTDRERLGRFLPWVPRIRSVQDELDFVRAAHEHWGALTHFDYLIFNDARALVGNLSVQAIVWKDAKCEIGYWLAAPFEGQGFLTRALQALEKTLFEYGFNRIAIRCTTDNERSAKVPLRNHYSFEGTLKEDTKIGDVFHDVMIFAKLRAKR